MTPRLRIDAALAGLQTLTLALIPILSAHTAFVVLGLAETRFNVIYELRGIVVRWADAPFALLLAATLLRLCTAGSYRRQLGAALARAGWAWAALALWMGVSTLWAAQPVLALYQALVTALMLVMALVLADAGRPQKRWLIIAVAGAGAFQALIALLQRCNGGSLGLAWLGEAPFSGTRGQGLTFNPNTLGGYLVICLFLGFLAFALAQRRNEKAAIALLLALMLGGMLATGSRGALIAALSGGALLAVPWLARLRARVLAALLASLMILGALLAAATQDENERGERLFFAFPGTLTVLQANPLLGAGAGSLMLRVDALAASGTIDVYEHSAHERLQPAHNAYLTLWAELGLVGLALFALGCWPLLAGLRHPGQRPTFILSCGLAALGIAMLVEFQFWLDPHWRRLLFWMIGLWWGWRLRAQDEATSVIPPRAGAGRGGRAGRHR